jgi:chromosome partitioning protein
MKTASIINFKGGVGKTTLSLHLACYLAQEHRVLLIDIDHQSSLSIVILGGNLWTSCVTNGRTVNKVSNRFVIDG